MFTKHSPTECNVNLHLHKDLRAQIHNTRTQLKQLTDVKRVFRSICSLSEMRVSFRLKDLTLFCYRRIDLTVLLWRESIRIHVKGILFSIVARYKTSEMDIRGIRAGDEEPVDCLNAIGFITGKMDAFNSHGKTTRIHSGV